MDNLFLIGFAGAALALLWAVYQAKKVFKFSEGNERMVEIASAIREGANAYLKHQYTTVAKVFIVVFVLLLILSAVGMLENWFVPFAFVFFGDDRGFGE